MNETTIRLHVEALSEGGYLATSPDVPGLVVEAQNLMDITWIAQDVARKIVESCIDHGDPIPPALQDLVLTPASFDLTIPVSTR